MAISIPMVPYASNKDIGEEKKRLHLFPVVLLNIYDNFFTGTSLKFIKLMEMTQYKGFNRLLKESTNFRVGQQKRCHQAAL